jgi:hypothetical protein
MKTRYITIFWSLVMIAAGIVFFLQNQGMIDYNTLSPLIWALIFGVLSLFFFLTYFLQGIQQWGWLFPATLLGSIAIIIGLSGTTVGDALSGAPVLLGGGIPFLVAFLLDKKNNWWALIPAWVMCALSAVVLFEGQVESNIIGSFVLYSIALPFFVVWLRDRTRKWALIPAGSLAVIGLIPLLESQVSGEPLGMMIMFLFALPFYTIYFSSTKNWWAMIPAGVFTSIGFVVLYAIAFHPNVGNTIDRWGTALLLTGIGLTFGVLWLRRTENATDWAKFPAVGLFIAALLILLIGPNLSALWAILFIVAGAIILFFGLRGNGSKKAKK